MKAKLLSDNGAQTYALVFDKGDEVSAALLQFASEKEISAASFNALGAFRDVTFGWFNPASTAYERIEVSGGIEVMSFVGNLAISEAAEPRLHAHVVVGKSDGTAHGGHFFQGHVWPTLEMFLTVFPEKLIRRLDEESGLALIDLG
jgi:predicted DNA-binding protein with PD1-like motif